VRRARAAAGRRGTWAALAAGALLAALYCAAAAARTWPLIDGDGPALFPPAVELSLGRPLTNPVWPAPLADSIDGPGGRRLVYHGFLYAVLTGTLGRALGGGAQATVQAAYLVHWLAACLAALATLLWVRLDRRPDQALAGALPLSMLALSTSTHGRMEPLVLLVVALALVGWRLLASPGRDAAAGAAAALLVFASPACGVLAFCVLPAALAGSGPDAATGRRAAAAAAGAAAGAALAIGAYPYPIADWVAGVARYSRIVLALPSGQRFVATWVAAPQAPLLALTFGGPALLALHHLGRAGRSLPPLRRTVVGVAAALFALGLARIAFMKTEASYNAIVWIPLLAALAGRRPRPPLVAWLLVAALALPATGGARSAALLARQFRADAVSFAEVRGLLGALPAADTAVATSLWLAAPDPAAAHYAERDDGARRWVVRAQTHSGRTDPPAVEGYAVRRHRYGPGVRVLGLPLSRTPNGWEYALYERRIPAP
jgi:hypothetical protein